MGINSGGFSAVICEGLRVRVCGRSGLTFRLLGSNPCPASTRAARSSRRSPSFRVRVGGGRVCGTRSSFFMDSSGFCNGCSRGVSITRSAVNCVGGHSCRGAFLSIIPAQIGSLSGVLSGCRRRVSCRGTPFRVAISVRRPMQAPRSRDGAAMGGRVAGACACCVRPCSGSLGNLALICGATGFQGLLGCPRTTSAGKVGPSIWACAGSAVGAVIRGLSCARIGTSWS